MSSYDKLASYIFPAFKDNPLIIIALTTLVFMIVYMTNYHFTTPKDKKGPTGSLSQDNTHVFNACSSPDCVRCQRYNDVRKKALHNFNLYAEKTEVISQKLDRILLGLEENKVVEWENDLQKPNVFFMRGLTAKPFYDTCPSRLTATTTAFESHWLDILNEFCMNYDNLCNGDYEGWHTNNTMTGQWSIFSLVNQGVRIEENCKRCPLTSKLIDMEAKHVMKECLFGNVLFSVLYPGTHITDHYGPTNVRLRCHLGLVIPTDCHLTVGGVSKEWIKGKCTLFDDSFWHSASNQNANGEFRAVLLVDIWHPDICDEEKQAIEHIFSSKKQY